MIPYITVELTNKSIRHYLKSFSYGAPIAHGSAHMSGMTLCGHYGSIHQDGAEFFVGGEVTCKSCLQHPRYAHIPDESKGQQ